MSEIWNNVKNFIANEIPDKNNVQAIEISGVESHPDVQNLTWGIEDDYGINSIFDILSSNINSPLNSIKITNTGNVTNFSYFVGGVTKLNNLIVNTSKGTDFSGAFKQLFYYTTLPSSINTANAIKMTDTFYASEGIQSVPGFIISNKCEYCNSVCEGTLNMVINFSNVNWDTSHVKSFSRAFCSGSTMESDNAKIAPLGTTMQINLANALDCSQMFWSCQGIQTANMLNYGDVWGKAAMDVSQIFQNCTNLTDLGGFWDVERIFHAIPGSNYAYKDISNAFNGCTNLVNVNNGIFTGYYDEDESSVIVIRDLFKNCPNLSAASINNIAYIFNYYVDPKNLREGFSIRNNNGYFYGYATSTNFNIISGLSDTQIAQINSNTKKDLKILGGYRLDGENNYYFGQRHYYANGAESPSYNVTINAYTETNNLSHIRNYLKNTARIYDNDSNISSYDIEIYRTPWENGSWTNGRVLNFSSLFYPDLNEETFIEIPSKMKECTILGCNTYSWGANYSMQCYQMFAFCYNLICPPKMTFFNVINAGSMFDGCINISTINDNYFDFQEMNNCLNTAYMFHSCSNITEVDLNQSSWGCNTNKTECMFDGCDNLKYIANLGTGKVSNFEYMFAGCSNLISIGKDYTGRQSYISSFNMNSATNVHSIFYRCNNLQDLSITNLKINNLDLSYCNLNPQSLYNIINNGLVDMNEQRTLNLGSKQLSRVNDELKAIATAKNWRLV